MDLKKFARNILLFWLLICVVLRIDGASSKMAKIEYGISTILFDRMNSMFEFFNRAIADMEWQTLKNSSIVPPKVYAHIFQLKSKWKNRWCTKLTVLRKDRIFVNRKLLRFFCNGPIYTSETTRKVAVIKDLLSFAYDSAQICKIENRKRKCYNGESDITKLMATSRNERELRWAWTAWRNYLSPTRYLFAQLVDLQNEAARNNGYSDIGAYWREGFEIPNLESIFEKMYRRVEPLYRLLHAVVRFRLAKLYPEVVDTVRPIPAHLLGNLWSQSWETLIDVILPNYYAIMPNLTDSMRRNNYNVTKMVKHAENFYISLGFPPLTSKFWQNSVFEKENDKGSTCHATAINMYRKDDFRIFACLETNPQDFNIIHHEIGHVQYYMAYQNQLPIFKNGINDAFHESVGDAISHGAISLRHIQRLNLTHNIFVSSTNSSHNLLEIAILLKQALFKIPQLPNGLIIEKWRWSVFSNKTKLSRYNSVWWDLHRRYMGIIPPSPRSEKFFDPVAKFHVAHDIPYAGYYLGNFLQVQLFQGMCEASMGLKVGSAAFNLSLHKCDIYGSQSAGRLLRSMMRLGSNADWRYALRMTTGYFDYRVEPLLTYYEPIRDWLQREIEHYKIPVGWD